MKPLEAENQSEQVQTDLEETQSAKTKSRKRKAAEGFLKFLMYGGWIVLAIVGLAIAIVVSLLTR